MYPFPKVAARQMAPAWLETGCSAEGVAVEFLASPEVDGPDVGQISCQTNSKLFAAYSE